MTPPHSGREEWRPETCPDCHNGRERAWATRVVPKGSPIPAGWQRTGRGSTAWRTIAHPTRWVTLCLCDI